MRKLIFILLCVLMGSQSNAQLPKWIIQPNHDLISVKVDEKILETDSLGSSALWTMDGRFLFGTEEEIHDFKDGVAVITKKGSNELVGTVDTNGKFTEFPKARIAYDHPYLEDGFIICSDSIGYTYYTKYGEKAKLKPTYHPYPFNKGYAAYLTYDNLEKKKDPYYGYYRADGKEMTYRLLNKGQAKDIDPKSLSFLSNIGNNQKGVAVIKNKLYLYNPETELFEPFLHGKGDTEKKRHLTLDGDYEKYFLNLPNQSIEIKAKYGNNETAILKFDKLLRPELFIFGEEEISYTDPSKEKYKYTSEISPFLEDSKYGLSFSGKKVVPQQFDEIGICYGNKGFVKHNGKWGVIEIIPDEDYTLKINKGQDVAFRHETFETQIRLDLPAAISAKDAKIDLPSASGCELDKTSRESKDTESGNFVTYNCTLNIPKELPDTITKISYSPVKVTYDGLTLFERPIDIKAWHYKYYNVDPIDSETSISNGVASFTFNINAQKNVGEGDYPFDIRLEADSVSVQVEKLSETRYKCLVSNLQDGNNNLNIILTEKGCPPTVFPFEVYYTKPTPKKKTKEAVVVRKKSPQAPKPAVRIEL